MPGSVSGMSAAICGLSPCQRMPGRAVEGQSRQITNPKVEIRMKTARRTGLSLTWPDRKTNASECHAIMRVRTCHFGVQRIKSQAFKAVDAIFEMIHSISSGRGYVCGGLQLTIGDVERGAGCGGREAEALDTRNSPSPQPLSRRERGVQSRHSGMCRSVRSCKGTDKFSAGIGCLFLRKGGESLGSAAEKVSVPYEPLAEGKADCRSLRWRVNASLREV
jgi:hypothetical protein